MGGAGQSCKHAVSPVPSTELSAQWALGDANTKTQPLPSGSPPSQGLLDTYFFNYLTLDIIFY